MLSGWKTEELLILVKTYPIPSKGHRETTCVAGINRAGVMRRLYPIPFRLMEGEHQFHKWQWIRANLIKANADHRPESHKVDAGSIERLELMNTRHEWQERRRWIGPHILEDFADLEKRRLEDGQSLGIVRPDCILGLDITPEKSPDWTEEEKAKLQRDCLFDTQSVSRRTPLRKVPFTFRYRYRCKDSEYRHLVTDWEIGALYWNCVRSHGPNWETPFREKMEIFLPRQDLMFLMGNVHLRPHQWLIVGLIYPPLPKAMGQTAMNFE